MSFIYLASPYSDPDPRVREMRYADVLRHVAYMTVEGKVVYSPIVHFHECALTYNMPKDFEFWSAINFHMLSSAMELCVLQLPGWGESRSVTAEIKYAQERKIPISYVYEANTH